MHCQQRARRWTPGTGKWPTVGSLDVVCLHDIGVGIAAVSADSAEQLAEHRSRLSVDFPVYHGLTTAQMQALGLYISVPRSEQETDHDFAEPGLFVINMQGALQVVDICNNPFSRPDPETLVSGLECTHKPQNNYPVRGTWKGTQST